MRPQSHDVNSQASQIAQQNISTKIFPGLLIASCYICICLISFLLVYTSLNAVETYQLRNIEGSVIFYANLDKESTSLANRMRSDFGVQTVDLLSREGGIALYKLTGARRALSPTLVMPKDGNSVVVSGSAAVQQILQPLISDVTPVLLARRALYIMAGLIVVSIVFSTEIVYVATFLPAIGIVAIAMLWGHCLHCDSSGSALSDIAPLLGLLYVIIGLLLFTIPVFRKKIFYCIFLVASGLVPSVQAYMLIGEPKLCPACLAITFVSAAYFVATLQALKTSRLPGIGTPRWVAPAFAFSIFCLLVRHTLVLGNYIQIGAPNKLVLSNISGSSFSQFGRSMPKLQPGMLYVVSQESCGACQTARQDLRKTKLEWQEVPVCTFLRNKGCFDGQSLTFATPLLIICNRSGTIIFAA